MWVSATLCLVLLVFARAHETTVPPPQGEQIASRFPVTAAPLSVLLLNTTNINATALPPSSGSVSTVELKSTGEQLSPNSILSAAGHANTVQIMRDANVLDVQGSGTEGVEVTSTMPAMTTPTNGWSGILASSLPEILSTGGSSNVQSSPSTIDEKGVSTTSNSFVRATGFNMNGEMLGSPSTWTDSGLSTTETSSTGSHQSTTTSVGESSTPTISTSPTSSGAPDSDSSASTTISSSDVMSTTHELSSTTLGSTESTPVTHFTTTRVYTVFDSSSTSSVTAGMSSSLSSSVETPMSTAAAEVLSTTSSSLNPTGLSITSTDDSFSSMATTTVEPPSTVVESSSVSSTTATSDAFTTRSQPSTTAATDSSTTSSMAEGIGGLTSSNAFSTDDGSSTSTVSNSTTSEDMMKSTSDPWWTVPGEFTDVTEDLFITTNDSMLNSTFTDIFNASDVTTEVSTTSGASDNSTALVSTTEHSEVLTEGSSAEFTGRTVEFNTEEVINSTTEFPVTSTEVNCVTLTQITTDVPITSSEPILITTVSEESSPSASEVSGVSDAFTSSGEPVDSTTTSSVTSDSNLTTVGTSSDGPVIVTIRQADPDVTTTSGENVPSTTPAPLITVEPNATVSTATTLNPVNSTATTVQATVTRVVPVTFSPITAVNDPQATVAPIPEGTLIPLSYYYSFAYVSHAFCSTQECRDSLFKAGLGYDRMLGSGTLGRIVAPTNTSLAQIRASCPEGASKLQMLYFSRPSGAVGMQHNWQGGYATGYAATSPVCGATVPIKMWHSKLSKDVMYSRDLSHNLYYTPQDANVKFYIWPA